MNLTIFFLTAIVGAIGGASIKFTLSEFPPMVLIFLRGVLAMIIIFPFVYFQKEKFKFGKEKKMLLATSSLFALNWILFAYGIEKTSIIMGQLIYLPTPIIVAILGYFFLREKLTKEQIIGLIITVFGLVVLFQGSIAAKNSVSFGDPSGNLIIFIGLVAWSLYTIVSRKISQLYSPLNITFINLVAVSLISLSLLIFTQSHQNFKIAQVSPPGVLGLFSIATLNSIGFFSLYQWLIKNTSAFSASLILYPTTILASIVGIVFFHEKLTLNLALGGTLIMSGVFLASSLKHVKKYVRS